MSKNDTLYLVDASGFIWRAFHALPPLTNPQKVPVGAVLGFVNMMLRLLKEQNAQHVGVIFDKGRVTFRNEIYPEYKANRDETPADLIPQFPLIRDATTAFGFEPLEAEGFEADDLIAAYAKAARNKGLDVVIVSSDKDLMQLIRDGVAMLDPLKGRIIGAPEVMERFGVTPDKVIEVQALCGDSTDNVPGVRGIGPKIAAELINTYGDLETLLDNLDKIKQPKRRESLIENAELARISKKLVTLDENTPLPKDLDALGSGDLSRAELITFLNEHGFKSVINRLGAPANMVANAPAPTQNGNQSEAAAALPEAITAEYKAITDMAALKEVIAQIKDAGFCAIDTETTALNPNRADIVGISLSTMAGRGVYIPLGHKAADADLLGGPTDSAISQLPISAVMTELKDVLEDSSVLKIGQNIKYDIEVFARHGIKLGPIDDTMLLSYVLDGAGHSHGMDNLARLHLGHETIKYEDVAGKGAKQISFANVGIEAAINYAAEDADITLRLHQVLKPRLAKEGMAQVYESMDRPIVPVVAEMEMAGIKIDPVFLRGLSNDFAMQMAVLEKEIQDAAGYPINIASPKQLGELLFGKMELPGAKKTKTGDFSTSADILEELAEQGHEIVQKILDWRGMAKLKSTYTDALPQEILPRTGRVHTSFALAHTSTGRFASSDPNVQNIPIRTEAGRKIREAFIADTGKVLLSIDYSQIELRLAAAMANIPALKDAFVKGIDIHAMTASEVFGVKMDEMTPDIRRNAKAINFGIIYGISAWGLAKQLGITPGQAGDYIKLYFSRFPELVDFMENTKEFARAHGYVTTLFGRKCTIDGIADKNGARRSFAERQAINAPLQGTAADIMKRAMVRIARALGDRPELDCKMLLQVHDELVFEVDETQAQEAAQLIKSIMESPEVADIGVPLIAEAGIGANWAKAH